MPAPEISHRADVKVVQSVGRLPHRFRRLRYLTVNGRESRPVAAPVRSCFAFLFNRRICKVFHINVTLLQDGLNQIRSLWEFSLPTSENPPEDFQAKHFQPGRTCSPSYPQSAIRILGLSAYFRHQSRTSCATCNESTAYNPVSRLARSEYGGSRKTPVIPFNNSGSSFPKHLRQSPQRTLTFLRRSCNAWKYGINRFRFVCDKMP